MSFSENLNKIMNERNISQTDLHNLTGIGKSSISQYLSGKNTPKGKTIDAIAEALECTVACLHGAEPLADGLKNIPVTEAARRMGKSEQYIRVGLQQQRLPFGTAVMMSSKYSYHISPKLLDAYIGRQ